MFNDVIEIYKNFWQICKLHGPQKLDTWTQENIESGVHGFISLEMRDAV
jgi:hypothetical protein